MKSRKFKAVLAAVSAIAVIATAMTGFAAPTVTSETTYNANDSKASVVTTVTLENNEGAEVTLLVKAPGAGVNGSEIAYIDQKPATGKVATFEYQLDKTALGTATAAVVTSGNDAGEATATGDLGLTVLNDVTETEYTINFTQDVYGAGDANVTASVTPAAGREITGVTLDGAPINSWASFPVPVAKIGTIVVTTKAAYVAPDVADRAENLGTIDNGDGKVGTPTVFKATGDWTEAGVSYKGYDFPAVGQANQEYIVVILNSDAAIDASAITPYAR